MEGLGTMVLEGGGLFVTYIVANCLIARSKPEQVGEPKQ